jgi:hypothetical protein
MYRWKSIEDESNRTTSFIRRRIYSGPDRDATDRGTGACENEAKWGVCLNRRSISNGSIILKMIGHVMMVE